MLKNRTISSILRYCKTKPRFLNIVTKTTLFQNRTNQGRVIPRPYCKSKTNYGRMIFLSLSIKISLGYETVILPK